METAFQDRVAAGQRLAEEVLRLGLSDPVVYALPRGGVPVAVPVAEALGAPLDLLMVKKIGVPGHDELAMGAVVGGDPPDIVWNDEVLRSAGQGVESREEAVARKLAEIDRLRVRYLGQRAPLRTENRDAVLVDDGIATGATVRAALKALRRRNPASITLAVPVAPASTLAELEAFVDKTVCLSTPSPFFAVGAHYVDFRQTSDDEVTDALELFGEETGEST